MKTDSIQSLLNAMYGPQDNYSDEQLQVIDSLNINRFDVSGEITNIEEKELLRFPNLKSLSLQQCVITDEFISILVQLKNLETLNLYQCEFTGDASKVFQLPLLKNVLLEGTYIPFSYLKDSMMGSLVLADITVEEDLSLYVDFLDIRRATIKNWNFLHNKIGLLLVSNTQYHEFQELQNYSGAVRVMDDSSPTHVVKEVNC